MSGSVVLAPEVQHAIEQRQGVVALETAVLTHGLPRHNGPPPLTSTHQKHVTHAAIDSWDQTLGLHHATVVAMASVVRQSGACPAVVGVVDGTLHIGMDDNTLARLANEPTPAKAGGPDLAAIMSSGKSAGTTVSGTLAACHLCDMKTSRDTPTIATFATGGIGGVHRNWQQDLDVSADLKAIGTTRCAVVCAGAKSLLDLHATLETLEALSVPVIGWKSAALAMFFSYHKDMFPLRHRAENLTEFTNLCNHHWQTLHQRTGIILSNPLPDELTLDVQSCESLIDEAEAAAASAGKTGQARTPFVLDFMARQNDGQTLAANIVLLLRNAALAGQIAAAANAPTG